jgi:erythrin-vacuolar iron transport family protein
VLSPAVAFLGALVSHRNFADLSEREILAVAITNEEEDARIFADFAEGLRDNFPASAHVFVDMAAEENEHRRRLIDLFVSKFGDHIPLIRRNDIKGYVHPSPIWQLRPLSIEAVRTRARQMEKDAAGFYRNAMGQVSDATIRKLLGDLAEAEDAHDATAAALEEKHLTPDARQSEQDSQKRRFVLEVVQPGLVGLMDGSVSTLAPVFTAAFATHVSWNGFLVGMSASLGAGISMGFAEALADDGKLSGRGSPFLRGAVTGAMTLLGGLGHTMPYLISDFWTATALACVVVVIELCVIAYVQYRFMNTPPISAAAKVMLGGGLVLAAGILIGSA